MGKSPAKAESLPRFAFPAPVSRLKIVTRTDPGRVRALNEDRLAVDSELGLVVLADGMGAQAAGSLAAELAVRTMSVEVARALRNREKIAAADENYAVAMALREGASKANRMIQAKAQSEQRYREIGTTLIAALFHGGSVTVAHVGDSRLYRLRNGGLQLMTRDHSLLQQQLASAAVTTEAARFSHNRHLVSRALGVSAEAHLDVKTEEVAPGDVYLLCSDGLNDVDDSDIELVLSSLRGNLELAASQLVMIARDMGGHDNISLILVAKDVPAQSWLAGLMRRLTFNGEAHRQR
jgi:protein phosphatase